MNTDQQEYLALALLALIGKKFVAGTGGCSSEEFSEQIGLPDEAITPLLQAMQQLGLLRRSQDKPPLWILGRDPDQLSIATLIDELRTAQKPRSRAVKLPEIPAVRRIQNDLKTGAAAAVSAYTLRELLTPDESDRPTVNCGELPPGQP